MPLSKEEVETFRQSLLTSAVVVGVNTTAMIEAAILGRPVLSVRDGAFEHSQHQTLHFGYLDAARGGCALVSKTLDEHESQLESVLADDQRAVDAGRDFVARFVRPADPSRRATDALVDALERLTRDARLATDGMPSSGAVAAGGRNG